MIENIGDKRNSNGFDKRPQDTKKGGRKKNGFAEICKNLQLEEIEPVTKNDYFNLLSRIFNLTEKEMSNIIMDENNPAYVRWILESWKNKKTRNKNLIEYRNWLFGKNANIEKLEDSPIINYNERRQVLARLTKQALLDKKLRESK